MDKKKIKLNELTKNVAYLYYSNKDFYNDIISIREKTLTLHFFQYNPDRANTYETENNYNENHRKILNKLTQENIFEKKRELDKKNFNYIYNLRKKYNLSSSYQKPLHNFVFEGDDDSNFYQEYDIPDELEPLLVHDPDNKKELLTVLNIDENTSIADIKKHWKEIKELSLSFLNKRNKNIKKYPRKNFYLDIDIFKQKNLGNKSSEISDYINNKYNTNFSYQDINIMIKRIRDKAKSIITG